MSLVKEMIHIVVISELLKSLADLCSSEETEIEQLYLLVRYDLVGSSVKDQRRSWFSLIVQLAFSLKYGSCKRHHSSISEVLRENLSP